MERVLRMICALPHKVIFWSSEMQTGPRILLTWFPVPFFIDAPITIVVLLFPHFYCFDLQVLIIWQILKFFFFFYEALESCGQVNINQLADNDDFFYYHHLWFLVCTHFFPSPAQRPKVRNGTMNFSTDKKKRKRKTHILHR